MTKGLETEGHGRQAGIRTQKLGELPTEEPCGLRSQLPVAAEDKEQEQLLQLLWVTAEGSHTS